VVEIPDSDANKETENPKMFYASDTQPQNTGVEPLTPAESDSENDVSPVYRQLFAGGQPRELSSQLEDAQGDESSEDKVSYRGQNRSPSAMCEPNDPAVCKTDDQPQENPVQDLISKARYAYSGLSGQLQNMDDRIKNLEKKSDAPSEKKYWL